MKSHFNLPVAYRLLISAYIRSVGKVQHPEDDNQTQQSNSREI
jgi:hypothetical protein